MSQPSYTRPLQCKPLLAVVVDQAFEVVVVTRADIDLSRQNIRAMAVATYTMAVMKRGIGEVYMTETGKAQKIRMCELLAVGVEKA